MDVAAVEVAGFRVEKLSGAASLDGGVVTARLAGTATQRGIEALDAFLAQVLGAAQRALGTTVVLDLRNVTYMNSAHLKSLVSWLGAVSKGEPRLEVRLQANPGHHWQRRSVEALGALAPGLVTVTVES
jgi:hypothetical protein